MDKDRKAERFLEMEKGMILTILEGWFQIRRSVVLI